MKDIISVENLKKLEALKNPYVMQKVINMVSLLKPNKVTVLTDSIEDQNYIKEISINNGEETPLNLEGHTYHFDSPLDQARDKVNTKYLLDKEVNWGLDINWTNRDSGLKEIYSIMDGMMKGKEMFVAFYCLGPSNSIFSTRIS